jgi:hypothetical protein
LIFVLRCGCRGGFGHERSQVRASVRSVWRAMG